VERGGVVPLILNNDTTWKVVVNVMTGPPYIQGMSVRKLVGNRSRSIFVKTNKMA
jgi:hypothetical protein